VFPQYPVSFPHVPLNKYRGCWKFQEIKLTKTSFTTLRLLPSVSNFYFVMRSRDWHEDVLVPGQSWTLLPVEDPAQTEFKTHETWCHKVRVLAKTMKDYLQNDLKVNRDGWDERKKRGKSPTILFKVIEGRKMKEMPFNPVAFIGYDYFVTVSVRH
jgi:hypothetical protein